MLIIKLLRKIIFVASFGVLIANIFLVPVAAMAQAPVGQDLSNAVGFKACNVSGGKGDTSAKLQECIGSILSFALSIAGIYAADGERSG